MKGEQLEFDFDTLIKLPWLLPWQREEEHIGIWYGCYHKKHPRIYPNERTLPVLRVGPLCPGWKYYNLHWKKPKGFMFYVFTRFNEPATIQLDQVYLTLEEAKAAAILELQKHLDELVGY